MAVINEEALHTAVHAALVHWGRPSDDGLELLSHLLVVQNQVDLDDSRLPFALRRAVDRVILNGLERLAEHDERGARVLQSRFVDGHITRHVAQLMHASPDQVNRWQRAAIDRLTEVVYHQETTLRATLVQQLESRLPPAPYSRFFGLTQASQALKAQLVRPTSPWIIAITGIGGIGKTSLAHFLAREVVPTLTYRQLCWLRVNNRQLSGRSLPPEGAYDSLLSDLAAQLWPDNSRGEPIAQLEKRLRRSLKASPHLVVIDNVETSAHIAHFTRKLRAFTDPSRFLLTSRARPSGETAVYNYTLQELPFDDAAALLRHHAEMTGLEEMSKAEPQTIEAIYEVTGGNPLALKLVVSLTAVLPLPQILADLRKSRVGPVDDLYRHIYWEAWRTLSPPAQTLLQALPLVAASGALPEQMEAISGLETAEFWTAVRELIARSLLEVRGTIQERRYGIHRLTETFLHTEIIHWPEILDE